jgi:pimeloyl-ACP methyl ester carboxylesterase
VRNLIVPEAARRFARREFSRDRVRLSYLENDADGPVVMLLHGLAGCGDEFVPTAEAVGGTYRFILPDLRGHGASTRHPADLSGSAFTADTAALIRHVSPDRPVTLGGQSMGGHTAILTAASCPELVGRRRADGIHRSSPGYPARGAERRLPRRASRRHREWAALLRSVLPGKAEA